MYWHHLFGFWTSDCPIRRQVVLIHRCHACCALYHHLFMQHRAHCRLDGLCGRLDFDNLRVHRSRCPCRLPREEKLHCYAYSHGIGRWLLRWHFLFRPDLRHDRRLMERRLGILGHCLHWCYRWRFIGLLARHASRARLHLSHRLIPLYALLDSLLPRQLPKRGGSD